MTQVNIEIRGQEPNGKILSSDKELVLFTGLPVPPSSNSQYFLARRGQKTYHIPSDELKQFKREMEKYPYLVGPDFVVSKRDIHHWIGEGRNLEIKTFFFFKRERLYTKLGHIKKLDCSNRIKALHDSLCDLLEMDDCLFFKLHAEKIACKEGSNEETWVEISPI